MYEVVKWNKSLPLYNLSSVHVHKTVAVNWIIMLTTVGYQNL